MSLYLYNTLGRKKEEFESIETKSVRMYTCGPTVYNYAHIGNLRSYVFADVLRKTLEYSGYEVKQVMNITDIGHLSSDADSGEDKMTKGLLREGKELTLENMKSLATFYTDRFNEDLELLNIKKPDEQYFASDYVKEDVELIQKLENNGYTYKTKDGLYFDTSKYENYGELWGGKREMENAEGRIAENSEKKNSADFALWKLNNSIGFESPWGRGFPGWHIECSAMGIKFLGEQFDIHTGGIDHISIHHTNEIAQSECATGKKPFVKYWLHHEFVDTKGEKMAKSGDNFLRLSSLEEHNIKPITYRFWLLMASYHTKVNFSWEALSSTEVALKRLYSLFSFLGEKNGEINKEYVEEFTKRIQDDLDTPKAISLLWDLIKDENLKNEDKRSTILEFDKILSLGFDSIKQEEIPEAVLELLKERDLARTQKDFTSSDKLRKEINNLGYEVHDTKDGQTVSKL